MYRIGEFSRLCEVPVKTLRYYDQIGLLRPAHVDRATGYRRYTAAQVEAWNRILVLRDLGFSLREVRALVADAVPLDQLRDLVAARHQELERRVAEERARLARAAARLDAIARADRPGARDVAVRAVGPRRVASLRRTVAAHDDCADLFAELERDARLGRGRRDRAVVWHACADGAIDCEVMIRVAAPIRPRGRVEVRELAGGDVAALVYRGDRDYLAAYGAIRAWIAASGVAVSGPKREVLLEVGPHAESMTEIQFPIGRGASA